MQTYDSRIALLGGVIDYAGTFPPAALPLDGALREIAGFRKELRHPWLCARMALPISDLKKVTSKVLFDVGSDGTPLLFTALGSQLEKGEAAEFARTVEWDLRELRRLNERGNASPGRYTAVAYESKLPPDFLDGSSEEAFENIAPALDRFTSLSPFPLFPYLEITLTENWQSHLKNAVEAMASWVDTDSDSGLIPGLKIRTGGKTPPTVDQLAEAIRLTVSHGLRFKATQGLHHALSNGEEFGFVNLFAALTLAQALGEESFGLAKIKQLLKATDKKEFQFGAKMFAWSAYELDLETLEAARRRHAGTFGSCSLKEPDDSLWETFSGEKHETRKS